MLGSSRGMNDVTREQLEVVEENEPALGLAKGFFKRLFKEDDWSFVIKTHALIESALNRVVQRTVQPEALGEFLGTLDVSGGRHSKVNLLIACELMEEEE